MLHMAGSKQSLTGQQRESLDRQKQLLSMEELLACLRVLIRGEADLRYAVNARLATEMILIQAMADRDTVRTAALQPQAQSKPAPQQATTTKQMETAPAKPAPVPESAANAAVSAKQETAWDRLNSCWAQALDEVKKQKISTHAFLREGKPVALRDGVLTLCFRDDMTFHRDKFRQAENKNLVEAVVTRLLKTPVTLASLTDSEFSENVKEPHKEPIKELIKEPAVEGDLKTRAEELFGKDVKFQQD
jgi:DNA polymerase-3 subunit gamma/tau